jgi:hypothetical protein
MRISDSSNSVDPTRMSAAIYRRLWVSRRENAVVKIRGFVVDLETIQGLFRTLCDLFQSY